MTACQGLLVLSRKGWGLLLSIFSLFFKITNNQDTRYKQIPNSNNQFPNTLTLDYLNTCPLSLWERELVFAQCQGEGLVIGIWLLVIIWLLYLGH
jgi:hypothetical protein